MKQKIICQNGQCYDMGSVEQQFFEVFKPDDIEGELWQDLLYQNN